MAIMMIACVSAFAQVPTVMMYQVQIKHGKAAAQDVTIEMQLRNTQNGSAVWSQSFNLTQVKNGSIQNLGLDFGDKVNLSTGEYWLVTIIDGEEMGCAKLTSVPYAMVAKEIEGVLTKDELIGTWKGSHSEESGLYEYEYTFKRNGTFTYLYNTYFLGILDETRIGSGIWKLNGAGNLYVKGSVNNEPEENVVNTYLDRTTGCLTIGAGDSVVFGDVRNLKK